MENQVRLTRSRYEVTRGTLSLVTLLALALSVTPCRAGTETSGAVSQFASEVTKDQYQQTDPPATPPVFRWDFSKADVAHTYSYQQEVRSTTDFGSSFVGTPDGAQQEISSTGVLLIRSQGDGTGELVLKDMKTKMKSDVGGGHEPQTMEQTMRPFVVQGVKEDGSGAFGDSPEDTFLKLLFQLPPKTLKVGESVDVPAQMPFNAMGSVLQIKGRSRIPLTGYVKIGTRTCAQLAVDTEISRLNVPAELKGEYRCSLTGTSVFYFDIDDRSFRSGTTALVMQATIDAPMPEMKIPGEDTPACLNGPRCRCGVTISSVCS